RLAESLGGARVRAVLVGSGVSGLADDLATYGADEVHLFDDAGYTSYSTEAYARAMALSVTETKATIVLLPFTATGKDLAPRLAGKVGAGLASDCVALSLQDGRLQARRPMYAGKLYATVAWEGEPQMATLRPNVFPLGKPDASRKAEVVKGTVDAS